MNVEVENEIRLVSIDHLAGIARVRNNCLVTCLPPVANEGTVAGPPRSRSEIMEAQPPRFVRTGQGISTVVDTLLFHMRS
jgi:hypothetical protein